MLFIESSRPQARGRTAKSRSKILPTLSLLVALISSCLFVEPDSVSALPVYAEEGIGTASALRHAVPYREFTQPLECDGFEGGDKGRQRKVNMIEWLSQSPASAYLLCIHAFGLSARVYSDFGTQMSRLGFDVAALDARGFGPARSQRDYKKIDFDGTLLDVTRLLKAIRKQAPGRRVFLVGESMGGAIAIRLAAEHPELVDGVICSAPAWQIYKIKRITAKGLIDRIFGQPGFAARSVAMQASTSERLQKQWLADRTYRTDVSIPEAYSYYRFMKSTPKNAERIRSTPTLVVQGLNDRLSKPIGAAELFNVLGSNRKQLAIVASGEHLVFEEGQLKPEVANFLAGWIKLNMREDGKNSLEPQVVVLDRDKMPAQCTAMLRQMLELSGIKVAKGFDRGI